MTTLIGAMALSSVQSGCASATPASVRTSLEADFSKAIAADPSVKTAMMAVDSPFFSQGMETFVSGRAVDGEAATAKTPFLSASIGKLVIAQAIFRAIDEGRLTLKTRLVDVVDKDKLEGLPVAGGAASIPLITIDMLLSHRSGIPDYFSGVSKDGAPNVFSLLASDPDRTWSRAQMLAYTKEHFAPVGRPGERFAYADTNTDLLGLVLEHIYQQPFHVVVRQRVLTPLGMTSSWYHAFEDKPAGLPAVAPVLIGDLDLTGRLALSADQAGGGLYTTLADLVALVRAFAAGRPVGFEALTTDASLDAMHAGIDVGRAAWRIRPGGVVFLLTFLPPLVGHSGASGAWAYYIAEHDAVVVGSVNQTGWQEKHIEFLLADVVPTLAKTPKVLAD